MNIRNVILLAALLPLSACASMGKRESEADIRARFMDNAGERIDHFSAIGGIDRWRTLGNNQLVVWTSMSNAYLLTVQPPCSELDYTNTIGLTTTTGTVSRMDSVHLGDRNQKCQIAEIRPVDYKRVRELEKAGG